MRKTLTVVALLASTFAAYAEPSPNLVKAVNFVFTNNENDTRWKLVDEASCTFKFVSDEQVTINNIDPKTINWFLKPRYGDVYAYVRFSGSKPVWLMTPRYPDMTSRKHEVDIDKASAVNIERHQRAWSYIFGEGGCKPSISDTPF